MHVSSTGSIFVSQGEFLLIFQLLKSWTILKGTMRSHEEGSCVIFFGVTQLMKFKLKRLKLLRTTIEETQDLSTAQSLQKLFLKTTILVPSFDRTKFLHQVITCIDTRMEMHSRQYYPYSRALTFRMYTKTKEQLCF